MKSLLSITIVFFSCFLHAQSSRDCLSLHSGIFYRYANGLLVYVREGNIQTEINTETADTTVWQVDWKNDCRYTLTYLYGQGAFATVAKTLKQKYAVDVGIIKSTEDYYIFQTEENKKTQALATTDTIWLKEQPSKLNQKDPAYPSFPGGVKAWGKYLSDALDEHVDELGSSRKEGSCVIQFTIEEDGSVSNVKALNMRNSKIARYAVEAIAKSPKWTPAIVDGKPKKSIKIQPVTLFLVDPKTKN